jgi:hypothetical protein
MTQSDTPPTLLVGNRTGGQGKTLVAQLLHYGYGLAGTEMRVVAADTSDVEGGRSKLGQILKTVDELGIGARMDQIKADPRKAINYWDKIGTHLKEGSTVIDLGANVLPMVFDWAQQRQAARVLKNSPISLVVPVTAQRQSIIDAVKMIEESQADTAQIPFQHTYVIFNAYHGSFDDLKTTREMRMLQNMEQKKSIIRVNMARCTTEVWERIEANFTRLSEVAQLEHDDFIERFELDPFAASGAHSDFMTWLRDTLAAFRSAKLIPAGLDAQSLQPAA